MSADSNINANCRLFLDASSIQLIPLAPCRGCPFAFTCCTMSPSCLRRLLKPLLFSLFIVTILFKLSSSLFFRASHGVRSPLVHTASVQRTPKAPQTTPQLGEHNYRPDGLLETNMDGPHPIYELIARAESEWEAKLQRASRTLGEAVKEYKRRYARRPPKGFDKW